MKKGENLGYLVTCKMQNGNVIPHYTIHFSAAIDVAKRFKNGKYTKEVKILKISTGAQFECTI